MLTVQPTPTTNDDVASTVSGITTVTGHGTSMSRNHHGRGGGGRVFGGRSRGGRGRNRARNNSSSNNTSTTTVKNYKFVGMTQDLGYNFFHIPAEKQKRTEFVSTLEVFRLFSSDKYKSQYRRLRTKLFEYF